MKPQQKTWKITIGSDHAGVEYKSIIIDYLEKPQGFRCGTFTKESVDYPKYTLVSKEVLSEQTLVF